MIKERTVQFMFWFTILFIIGGVGACQMVRPLPANLEKLALSDQAVVKMQEEMSEEKLAAEMKMALQQDQEVATLATALSEESQYGARVEVRP